jgi:hypothetical protein
MKEIYDIIAEAILGLLIFLTFEAFRKDPLGFLIFLLIYILFFCLGSWLGDFLNK